jgi:peptidoglycan biosynthesis protein MviN/MurJ (putative lipid II flippase)
MGSALFFMSFGMVGFGVKNVLMRVFYAEKKGKIPLVAGFVSVLVNLILCWLLVDRMGVAGLGLASAVSLLVAAGVLIPATHRLFGEGFITRPLLWALSKMILAAIAMGLVVYVLRDALPGVWEDSVAVRLLLVGVPAIVGVLTYMGLAHVLRLDEMKTVFALLRRRRKEGA